MDRDRSHAAMAPALEPDLPHVPALHEVFRAHVDFVFRVCRTMGVGNAEIDDVVQEVFLVVHRRLPDFAPGASLRPWLFGIASGVVRNHRRGAIRRSRRLELIGRASAGVRAPDQHRIETAELLRRFIDTLDEDQRMSIVLVEVEGMTPDEAATALGVRRNTLYSRLRLVREKLRRFLAGQQAGDR